MIIQSASASCRQALGSNGKQGETSVPKRNINRRIKQNLEM